MINEKYSVYYWVRLNDTTDIYVWYLWQAAMVFGPRIKGLCCVMPVAPP